MPRLVRLQAGSNLRRLGTIASVELGNVLGGAPFQLVGRTPENPWRTLSGCILQKSSDSNASTDCAKPPKTNCVRGKKSKPIRFKVSMAAVLREVALTRTPIRLLYVLGNGFVLNSSSELMRWVANSYYISLYIRMKQLVPAPHLRATGS